MCGVGLNMDKMESHLKKNARALGCDMVDFKPKLLPGSGAAAHTWRRVARQKCNRMWMNYDGPTCILLQCDTWAQLREWCLISCYIVWMKHRAYWLFLCNNKSVWVDKYIYIKCWCFCIHSLFIFNINIYSNVVPCLPNVAAAQYVNKLLSLSCLCS